MKKKMIGIALVLMLAFSLCVPSFAADEPTAAETVMEMRYVIDTYNLLSFDEWTALEEQAANISEQYSCGVYIFTVDDYTSFGDGSVWDVAAELYNSSDFGFGAGHDGIILLLSLDSRDYALYVCGERAEYAFSDHALEQLEDAFLGDLGNGNWSGGLSRYLSACGRYLAGAREEKPVQAGYALPIVVSVVISCVIALIICLVLGSMMKTVHKKNDAREYVAASGLRLTQQADRYTHTTETRRKIESNTGGSRSSGGGADGHSGKF